MKIIKDKNGNVINIGEWNYKIIETQDGKMIITNPLPEGACESEEEVSRLDDGSFVLKSDLYIYKRKNEYPPIEQQLDMIYHDFDKWKSEISKIKKRHPKGK